MLYPLTFQPIFMERVWGGRNLEKLYQKPLPPARPIGESWEISDRPEAESLIAHGSLAGKSLRWLMENQPQDVMGSARTEGDRFPLLIKILDAQETLSVQVHPPAALAARLGGEPKTEMWYDGTVADCLHRIRVRGGDAVFLPSGRLHAIGEGNVIFEIQQNSDTTYRVFDWNRVGLDGKPRELHVAQSLASINFDDFEPALIFSQYSRNRTFKVRYLVDDPLFRVDACQVRRGQRFHLRSTSPQILGLLRGRLVITHAATSLQLKAGEFCLLPACLERVSLQAETQVEFLHVQVT